VKSPTALQRLHWLPFKIATVVHPTLNQRGPAYLSNYQIQQRRIWTSPSPFR